MIQLGDTGELPLETTAPKLSKILVLYYGGIDF